MLSVGDVVEYLSSLGAVGLVGDVDECGVEYHLVEGEAAVDNCLGQQERVGCGDVGRLSPDVLGAGDSSDGCVELRGAVAAVDGQGSAPCRAEGLEDTGHEEDYGVPCWTFGYGVVDAQAESGVAALHLGPGKVLGYAVSGCVPVHACVLFRFHDLLCLLGCACRRAVFWRGRRCSRSA